MKVAFCVLFLMAGCLVSCSPISEMTAHERESAFYTRFVNESGDVSAAKNNLDKVKLLQTGSEYPMRMALFPEGTFYYQVDNLGDGEGRWDIKDGVLRMRAIRPLFDMHLFVSGEKPVGDEAIIRFIDRHGFNSLRVELRHPAELEATGKEVPTLPIYQFSNKGI